jgi:hypothetical protein
MLNSPIFCDPRIGVPALAKRRVCGQHCAMNPFGFFVICVAGWMNRNQQDVIEGI